MTNDDETRGRRPSLLDPEARGGDTSEGGISFQASVIVSYIPVWMSLDGFTAMLREGMFDAEAKFFAPGRSNSLEAVEVKDHVVTPVEFWKEIERFRQVDVGAEGEYRWFTLACAGLSQGLQPLRNGLRRMRGPYRFYDPGSSIADASYADYLGVARALGRTEEEADFLFRKVQLLDDLSENRSHGKALFIEALCSRLPGYSAVSRNVLDSVHADVAVLLQSRRNQIITRPELEAVLRRAVPAEQQPPTPPVRLYTASSQDDTGLHHPCIAFEWARFFSWGGQGCPLPADWNQHVVAELVAARDWLLKHRSTRHIRLEGNRRLSASLAIGAVFSAVGGFSIEMIHREGVVWPTTDHPQPETPPYASVDT